MFLSLLPLKAAGREQLLQDLKEMDVPTDKLIGGKLMGMLDIPGLSGGQRKKLLLALSVQMALARNAKAMVLDEPFAGIDGDSMPGVLQVLKRVERQREDVKVFLVTHDHFQLIEDAFPGTPELKIDHRELRVASAGKHAQVGVLEEESSSDDHLNTAEAANVMAQSIHSASERRTKEEKPTKPPLLDWYVVKRHFYEGEQMLPTFTIIVFGVLSGVATGRYQGFGEGIVPLSSIFAFLKVFMLEYIHFGSILNYCYKRGQHLEDVGLMVTSKKDAIAETVVIATIQSVALAFLLNGLLIAIGPRFWWVNSNILFIDAFYALLTQVAYTLLPVVQPNPLITMGSIFPYVAVWCVPLLSSVTSRLQGLLQRLFDSARVRPQELALVHPLLAHLPLRLRRRQGLRRPAAAHGLRLQEDRHPPRLPLALDALRPPLHLLRLRPRRPPRQERPHRRRSCPGRQRRRGPPHGTLLHHPKEARSRRRRGQGQPRRGQRLTSSLCVLACLSVSA